MNKNAFEPIKIQVELEDRKNQERKIEKAFKKENKFQEYLKRFIFFTILLLPTLLSIILYFATKRDTIEYFKKLQTIKIPEKECQVFLDGKKVDIKQLIKKKPVVQALGVYTGDIGEIRNFPMYIKRLLSEIIQKGSPGSYNIYIKNLDFSIYLKQGIWIFDNGCYYRYVNIHVSGKNLASPTNKYKFYKSGDYITSRRTK